MTIAIWKSDYETGHLEIDDQHKALFTLINNLADSISQGATQETVKQQLDAIINDTEIHFKSEQELMGSLNYSGYLNHRAAHDNIQKDLLKVSMKFADDSSFLTLEVVQSLQDLLLQHICEKDLPMMQSLDLEKLSSV